MIWYGMNTLHQSTTPRDGVTTVGSYDDSDDVYPYKARKLMQVKLMVPKHDAILLWFKFIQFLECDAYCPLMQIEAVRDFSSSGFIV